MVGLAERLVDAGHAYETAERQRVLLGRLVPGVRPPVGQHDRRRSAPAIAATSSRTSATRRTSRCGKRPATGRLLKWPTPRWGDGFPGWHLECSAMAMRYLGDRFDIHTGGIDNVFPHHEDEIAQSAPLVGGPPATHWVHGEFLLMAGQKMAKSAGNFQRVTELARPRLRPARVPLPGADLALRPQAQLLRHVPRERRGRARLAPRPAPRSRRAAGRRPVGGPAPRAGRPAIGRMGRGLGSGRRARSRPRSASAPLRRRTGGAHDAFVAALDDDLDLPRPSPSSARSSARPPARRATLARRSMPMRSSGLDLDRVWEPPLGHEPAPTSRARPRSRPLVAARDGPRRGSARDFARADAASGPRSWPRSAGSVAATTPRRPARQPVASADPAASRTGR